MSVQTLQAPGAASGLKELAYDYTERLFVAVLSGSIILRFVPTLAAHPFNAVLLASECAVVRKQGKPSCTCTPSNRICGQNSAASGPSAAKLIWNQLE